MPDRRRFLVLIAILVAAGSCERNIGQIDRTAGDPPPNVLLIVLDTVRADHLGLYGYSRSTSPHLDALGAKSEVYERAISSSPWTLPSLGSILTSTHPHEHHCGARTQGEDWNGKNISAMGKLATSIPSLPELLNHRGYFCHIILANPIISSFGVTRGFQTSDVRVGGDSLPNCRRARAVTDAAIEWLDGAAEKTPFFALVHYIDPHAPYDPVQRPSEATVADYARQTGMSLPRARAIAFYDAEIREVDTQIGRLLEYLKGQGLYEDMVIIVTADHGEELWDHSEEELRRGPTVVCSKQHGHSVFQELLHVPLIIKSPGGHAAGLREKTLVGTIDIMPTVLSLAGTVAPATIRGVPLGRAHGHEINDARVVLAEHLAFFAERKALLRNDFKLVRNAQTTEEAFFDLRRDPGERTPLEVNPNQEIRQLMRDLLQEAMYMEQLPGDQPETIDDETTQQLKALGYID